MIRLCIGLVVLSPQLTITDGSAQRSPFCVRVILHLKKPKGRNVQSHLLLLTEVIGLLILYIIVLWNPSEESFELLRI